VVIKTVVELNVPKGIVDVPVVHAPIGEVVVAIADRLYPFTITGVAVLESCTENAVGKPGGVAYTGEVPAVPSRVV
jgi:hypothetical protein